ncbi:Fur family transcriptional regulator [Salsipaludibacter albus]|uniref:Fur family transcriptional regulator n=1 Tax=Salsipaludibacter albus TaxID=2849650 RepID=UPI001EE45616|nr:Fur family transcriptional regulator [Salsipaludibacter albus]MBY5162500.1 transcriptional repressor [Salsipaludibacter albus]
MPPTTAATDGPDTVEDRLRAAGWRMTVQRRVIAEAFDQRRRDGRDVHLTAEQVLAAARATLPDVSLATVYNTLNDLVELGALAEVSPDDGPRRYDANVADDHQHLVCVDCSRVVDVHLPTRPTLGPDARHGFDVAGVEVTFRGRCPDCRAA